MATPNIHIGIIAGKLNGVMPGADAERLAHRIDVDAGAGALGIFALQRVRDAAGELDHFEPALDVALGVGDDLAVLGRRAARRARPCWLSTSALNLNMTRARRCGLVAAQAGCAALAASTRARASRRCRARRGPGPRPRDGFHTSLVRLPSATLAAVDEMLDAAHGTSFDLIWPRPSQARPRMPAWATRRMIDAFDIACRLAVPPSPAVRSPPRPRRIAALPQLSPGVSAARMKADVEKMVQLRHAAYLVVADRPQARDRRRSALGRGAR